MLDPKLLGMVLLKKLSHKGLAIASVNDFLPQDTGVLKSYWEKDLEQQINSLPPIDEVIEELRDMLNNFVSPYLNSSYSSS